MSSRGRRLYLQRPRRAGAYRRARLWQHARVRAWKRLGVLVLALCLGGAAPVGCGGAGGEVMVAQAWPEGLAKPADAAEAERLKQQGTSWTNSQARQLYLERVAAIAGEDARWRAERVPAEERARRAFGLRRAARMTSRAMMADAAEVTLLQERDREKYGGPDGPTFEWLVEKARAKGLEGDALFESIVESAQRTDGDVNRATGTR